MNYFILGSNLKSFVSLEEFNQTSFHSIFDKLLIHFRFYLSIRLIWCLKSDAAQFLSICAMK